MERPHFDIVASGARMRAIRQERKISVKQVMGKRQILRLG